MTWPWLEKFEQEVKDNTLDTSDHALVTLWILEYHHQRGLSLLDPDDEAQKKLEQTCLTFFKYLATKNHLRFDE